MRGTLQHNSSYERRPRTYYVIYLHSMKYSAEVGTIFFVQVRYRITCKIGFTDHSSSIKVLVSKEDICFLLKQKLCLCTESNWLFFSRRAWGVEPPGSGRAKAAAITKIRNPKRILFATVYRVSKIYALTVRRNSSIQKISGCHRYSPSSAPIVTEDTIQSCLNLRTGVISSFPKQSSSQ